jgi:hypothetical protein
MTLLKRFQKWRGRGEVEIAGPWEEIAMNIQAPR